MKTPKISIYGTSHVFEGNLTTSILNILLRNDFPIQTICGGKAECGKDLIRVRNGLRFLSSQKDRESRILKELADRGHPTGPDIRLACQCYVHGDVEIEVFNLSGKRKEA
ncbi:MAG TPA: hypothetical protein VMM82_12365 [Spirochaetia bacterium]|nr:hypothetical protein [Spirochaetia bacterium]